MTTQTHHHHNNIILPANTAMGMAERYKGELKKKLIEIGNPKTFSEYFYASYSDDLPNEELTVDKMKAVVTFLLNIP